MGLRASELDQCRVLTGLEWFNWDLKEHRAERSLGLGEQEEAP